MSGAPISKRLDVEVAKVDDRLGLIIGYAIVCKVDGEEYVDLQGDVVPEEVALKAALDFMLTKREARDGHGAERAGDVVFAFPLISDVADALQISTRKTGLIVGIKPSDPALLDKCRSGAYSGLSIGGYVRGYDDAA